MAYNLALSLMIVEFIVYPVLILVDVFVYRFICVLGGLMLCILTGTRITFSVDPAETGEGGLVLRYFLGYLGLIAILLLIGRLVRFFS